MKRRAAVLALSLALAACRPDPTGPGDLPGGGVRGVVLLGPTCPVVTEASPCPDERWNGTVRASRGDDYVEHRTDERGRFAFLLEPGTWTLIAVVDGGGAMSAKPVPVTVPSEGFVEIDLLVDTGIR